MHVLREFLCVVAKFCNNVLLRNFATTHSNPKPCFGACHCEILPWHVTPPPEKEAPKPKLKNWVTGPYVG